MAIADAVIKWTRRLSLVCFIVGLGGALAFWACAPYPMEMAGIVLLAIVSINSIAIVGLVLGALSRNVPAALLSMLLLAGFWLMALVSRM